MYFIFGLYLKDICKYNQVHIHNSTKTQGIALSKLKSAPQCQQTAAHTTDSDTTHIFISGAHCDTDEAQLKAHLDVMNVTGCIVKEVSSKKQHRDWKSHRVN